MKNGLFILAFVSIALGTKAQNYVSESKAVPELLKIEFPHYLQEMKEWKELKLPLINRKPMYTHRQRYNDDVYWQPSDPKPTIKKQRHWLNSSK